MARRPHSSPAASPAGEASAPAARGPSLRDLPPDAPSLALVLMQAWRRYVLALKRHGLPRQRADRLVRWMGNQVNAIYGGTQ